IKRPGRPGLYPEKEDLPCRGNDVLFPAGSDRSLTIVKNGLAEREHVFHRQRVLEFAAKKELPVMQYSHVADVCANAARALHRPDQNRTPKRNVLFRHQADALNGNVVDRRDRGGSGGFHFYENRSNRGGGNPRNPATLVGQAALRAVLSFHDPSPAFRAVVTRNTRMRHSSDRSRLFSKAFSESELHPSIRALDFFTTPGFPRDPEGIWNIQIGTLYSWIGGSDSRRP